MLYNNDSIVVVAEPVGLSLPIHEKNNQNVSPACAHLTFLATSQSQMFYCCENHPMQGIER